MMLMNLLGIYDMWHVFSFSLLVVRFLPNSCALGVYYVRFLLQLYHTGLQLFLNEEAIACPQMLLQMKKWK
uniref:Uncharacterized protein n=1 Tax=Arundo donax TaxID=35708 RepID=A0A0A9A0M5_ARUDO